VPSPPVERSAQPKRPQAANATEVA